MCLSFMKKELILSLTLAMLLFVSIVYSQNETISEEDNTTTTLEENKTLVTQGNKTEGLKTLLSDCSKICTNKEGCACIADCEKKETNQGFNCGKKIATKSVTPPVKEVSLCDGCLVDRTCLEIGTQRQESEGTALLYCSSGKKLETAKEAGENCNNDYECLTYTCNEGICFGGQEEETGIKSSQIILILVVVIFAGGLTFLALKFLNTKKAVVKEEKKIEKKGFEIQEPEQKYSYKYKPEFDVLEKKLKESLGKIKNK